MEESSGDSEPLEKNRFKKALNVIILASFIVTIALLIYMVYLYYPLMELIREECYRNVTTAWNGTNLINNTTFG